MRRLTLFLTALLAAVLLTACTSGAPTAQENEDKSRQSNYEKLAKSQPAATMDYSPTRATKNYWVETWGEPGKLSYVYLLNSVGDTIGYYVLEGLPVSYCTSLIPPYQLHDVKDDGYGPNLVVPGPSIDGTYGSSANCNVFYGKDATTGSYVEYTTGQGINALLYDQPLPRFADAEPLGLTTTEQVQ